MSDYSERLTKKDWVADDEWLEGDDENVLYWKTETYITGGQLILAAQDKDVVLGDVERDSDDGFRVSIYPQEES